MPIITALPNYAALNSVSDVLPIVDITNNVTKKVPWSVLLKGISQAAFSALSNSIGNSIGIGIAAWTDVFSIFGPNVANSTGGAVGIGYDNSSQTGVMVCITPNTAWQPMHHLAESHLFYSIGTLAVTIDNVGDVSIVNNIKAGGYKSSDGSQGVSGSFTTVDLKTVTVKDGIITSIV